MHRTMIAVISDGRAWQIRLPGCSLGQDMQKITAIERAIGLAEQRHACTGTPTGVEVYLPSGRRLTLGLYG